MIGKQFHTINRSRFFGEQPWMKQDVAHRMLELFSGYSLSDGLKTIGNHTKTDFIDNKKYTDIACSGSSGFLLGLFATSFITMTYLFAGVGYGFKNAGLPGAVVGLFNGLYKGLTFFFQKCT